MLKFAQLFVGAQSDSYQRIVEGNLPMLQAAADDKHAAIEITPALIRDKWSKSLGHFCGVRSYHWSSVFLCV
jgi:hypothetical protein